MELKITQEASAQLNEINVQNKRYLVLWYDTDGCGCGVNGMPTIRFTDEKKPLYKQVANDLYATLVHERQAVFFAKNLKLDFVNGTFRLSSPEGILNPFIAPQSLLG